MRDALTRLYQARLQLLAILCTTAGIALLLLARWAGQVQGWEWVTALPVTDIGSALFTTGLIVVAFEYIDRTDGEIRAVQRLRQVLREQAPAMRDAVIDGFAFKPDDLQRVASPDTLDRIARNSLAIQLGDRSLAQEVYADVREQGDPGTGTVVRPGCGDHLAAVGQGTGQWARGDVRGDAAVGI